MLETFIFFLRAKLGVIWKKLGMDSLPGGQSCHQVFMLLILLSLSVLLKLFRDFLHLFCTVYASLLFLIERKSLNHFNKTDKLNKISSIKTWNIKKNDYFGNEASLQTCLNFNNSTVVNNKVTEFSKFFGF